MPLRDYQTETINDIYKSMAAGNHRIVVQQPPRTGKTVIMAEIAKRATQKGNRVLTVVHRKELVDQIASTYKKWGVDMSFSQTGMVQTLSRRIKRLTEPAIIIIDEGHHALAKTYRKIIEAFPDAVLLLFTATPYRLSGEGLGIIADDLIQGKSVKWLIDNGFLAPVKYYAPPDINAELLRRRNGEFTNESIATALKSEVYGSAIVQYKRHAYGMKAIAYCYSVESAKRLADEFNAAGIAAVEVDGETSDEERAKAVEDFRTGNITVMTNVELFTEGLDLPNVDCVIQLRPTQSLSLYLQFAMRAMNPREGKTAVILDHVRNAERFGLPTDYREWSLDGEQQKKQNKRETEKNTSPSVVVCPTCFSSFYVTEVKDSHCPDCGAELPKARGEVVTINGDLQEIKQTKKQQSEIAHRLKIVHQVQKQNASKLIAGKRPSELKTLQEFQLYATAHDYKSGWAYYQAKKKGVI
ncbi:DEAD/DEAH box helicase [Lacticaseibacillus saniviri]|uniref:Type III restriction protein res subunit n=1 Tax=Lacticaseibacillus saniviri JCM 17471 = DSM 24301 TaxID=1293598 RepID=A0A0R2MRL3_9LACO|nr:DEAD/DEAH box helicase [Lacticaseibacillus saniviri]KRO16231.1 type III restriction protein res subunit [Lacticaseibacillus saniviri JCM 17471 = DSM 24301]